MKKLYFDILFEMMSTNKDIFLICCGLGYPRFEEFKAAYPDRVFNTEASEQASLDIACGLALKGKIPFVYSITPFLLWRGAETIRTYIDHESIPVILIGAGRDEDYGLHDGFSHSASDDKDFICLFDNIHPFWPEDEKELTQAMNYAVEDKHPYYINLTR